MKGAARLLVLALAALALFAVRGRLRELGRRLRLAALLFLTASALSLSVRGLFLGQDPLWALAALVLLGPSLVMAWRDFLAAERSER